MVLKQEEEEQEVMREESQLYEDTVHWPVGTKLDFSFSSWPYEKLKVIGWWVKQLPGMLSWNKMLGYIYIVVVGQHVIYILEKLENNNVRHPQEITEL